MLVHIAYMQYVGVNPLGKVVSKSSPSTTYNDVMTSTQQLRVSPNPVNPSTGDPLATPPTTFPTIDDYLIREALAGYKATFISATMIVSYNG